MPEPVAKVILDPSVLFSEEAQEWLESPELRSFLVVSQALWERLEDPSAGEQFVPFRVRPSPEDVNRVREALTGIPTFSGDRPDVSEGTQAIRDALLTSGEPLADVLADEWVFLTMESMAVIRAIARRTLDAFERAGAQVHTLADDVFRRGLEGIREHLPPGLLEKMKRVGGVPSSDTGRIVVLGGSIAALLVPHVGLPLAIITTIQQGVAVAAGDP